MRVKKRTIQSLLLAIGFVLILVLFLALRENHDRYFVDDKGVLYGPSHIDLHATRALKNLTQSITIYRVTYQSQGWTIVGDLYVPEDPQNAILILPGGGVSKEGARAATYFAQKKFLVLIPDQRGVGETGGPFNSIDQDYVAFMSGQTPTNHLLILDALAGLQLLKEQPEMHGKLLLAGESMGGRAATVAARIAQPDGLIVISSAGYNDPFLPEPQKRFLRSIDPDNNIQEVTSPIIFLHSTNDTTISLANAKATFARATAPKKLFVVDHCSHGYCSAMDAYLDAGLSWLLKA